LALNSLEPLEILPLQYEKKIVKKQYFILWLYKIYLMHLFFYFHSGIHIFFSTNSSFINDVFEIMTYLIIRIENDFFLLIDFLHSGSHISQIRFTDRMFVSGPGRINQTHDLSTNALGNRDEMFSPARRALIRDRRKCVSWYTRACIFRVCKEEETSSSPLVLRSERSRQPLQRPLS